MGFRVQGVGRRDDVREPEVALGGLHYRVLLKGLLFHKGGCIPLLVKFPHLCGTKAC